MLNCKDSAPSTQYGTIVRRWSWNDSPVFLGARPQSILSPDDLQML
jgi:hypothetical protein